MSQAYRVPTWLEPSANAPGVESRAIGLHKRLNGAFGRGDVMEGLRLMRELDRDFNLLESVLTILRIEVRYA